MGRPADAAASELELLDDEELLHEIRSCPPGSARRDEACEVLVGRYRGLVRSCANRYRRSPEPTEDLVQVGYVGLLKAINNFDPHWPDTLTGFAKRAHEFWQKELEPHGYKLRAQIMDFPGGMPGDIGIFLRW